MPPASAHDATPIFLSSWSPYTQSGILCHLCRHRGPLSTVLVMTPSDLRQAQQYGCHGSALCDIAFIWAQLAAQTSLGHKIFLLWTVVRRVPGLCLSLVGLIPHEDLHPCLVFNYTWSGLNSAILCKAPPEAMQFGQALARLLHHIFQADLALGPVSLSKVDLADVYMHVWVRPEDITRLACILPPHPSDIQTPFVFHLYLLMSMSIVPPTSATLAILSLILLIPDGGGGGGG